MRSSDIKTGETYLFVATDAPERKHLEGFHFKVEYVKTVWRKVKHRSRQVQRFYNSDGVGARAEELEPLDDFDKLADVVTKTAEAFEAAGKAATLFGKNERPESDYRDEDDLPF